MIIYGTGEKKLTTSTSHHQAAAACPQCGERAVTFHFFKKYFHLFWLPIFPIGSRQVAYCEKCNVSYQESIPASLRMDLENAKSTASKGYYLYSGLALIILAISYFVFIDDGSETYYYPSKKKQAVGRMVNGKNEGKWTYWYESGALQGEQYYKDGKEDSVWTWYDENGNKTKIGHYKKGVSHGLWTFYYPSGKLKEEDMFVENRLHGLAIAYYENGKKYSETNYDRDLAHGSYKDWYDNGNIMTEGAFDKNVKVGTWKTYTIDGKPLSVSVAKDSLLLVMSIWDEQGKQTVKDGTGIITYYFDNKLKSEEGGVKDGLFEGLHTAWYANGKLKAERNYKKGSFTLLNSWNSKGEKEVTDGTGYYRSYDEQDSVVEECPYKNGKKNGLYITRSTEHVVLARINYVDDKMYGSYKSYYDTGELRSEGECKKDLSEGRWIWYHQNGQREAVVEYVHGLKEGEETFWSEQGDPIKSEYYKAGKLIREELYADVKK